MYDRRKHRNELKNFEKILEIKKNNIFSKVFKKSNSIKNDPLYSREEQEYVMSNHFMKTYSITENKDGDEVFMTNFRLEKYMNKIFAKLPPNKEVKYSRELMTLAMEYGMILQIQYRGADDNFMMGRTRVVYPMCLGTSSKGKPLLRVYHLKGWSFSEGKNTDKVWRLFRTDRIMSMSFTGMFFRLPPEGYNDKDKGMRGGITKAVNFEELRKNQRMLLEEGSIQNTKEVSVDSKNKVSVIEVSDTGEDLELRKPFKNNVIDPKTTDVLRITFLQSATGNKRMAVLGAMGKRGNTVKVTTEDGKYLGVFKVVKFAKGRDLGKPHMKIVKGKSSYPLYVFIKKK